jgi:Lon protease-like protein
VFLLPEEACMSKTPATTHEHIIHVPDVIPIFPLPRTVMLPGEVLPLHIFEPRYREMVGDAIARSRVIGMVEVSPGYEDEHLGEPPVEKTGCVGIIRQFKRLEDGRYLLWLFGLQRFEIESELEVDTSYRQARVSYTESESALEDLASVAPMRREMRQLLPTLVQLDDDTRKNLEDSLDQVDDAQLIALATQILQLGSDRKREILDAHSNATRFRLVFEDLYAALEHNPELEQLTETQLN